MTRPKYASGWYLVCFSDALPPSGVKPLRLFGRDFVLYRTEGGRPVLLDAFCPHLGAHLGHGGRVDGERIVCPFHAWEFEPEGSCAKIPYASRIPPRASIESHRVEEHSGMILGHFGSGEPDYAVPRIEQLGDPAWTPMKTAEIEIRTEPREVIENVADLAHFRPVHNTKIDEFEVIIDGPRATQRSVGKGRNLEGEKIDVVSVATYHGPAVQFTELEWAYPMFLVNAHVPIEEGRLLLRFGVMLRAGEGVTLPPEVLEAHIAAARDGYFEDVAIWEHKRWRDRPTLADGDGPIGQVRAWYDSFFEEVSA